MNEDHVNDILVQNTDILVEICCGSYYDAIQAAAGGATRIELNSALMLGGLTPTTATLELVKKKAPSLKVIAMVRPRGAGFCYLQEEFEVMKSECRELLAAGADGIAFGCLKQDSTLDIDKNRKLIALVKEAGKEAVFHRAFDCVIDPHETIETLIDWEVDRILTSGLQAQAMQGRKLIGELQRNYGDRIQILAGSGINAENAGLLIKETGIFQIHSSCKDWISDNTTEQNGVSFSMASGNHRIEFDVVSAIKVKELINAVR